MGEHEKGNLQINKPVYEIHTEMHQEEHEEHKEESRLLNQEMTTQDLQKNEERHSIDFGHKTLENAEEEAFRRTIKENLPPKYRLKTQKTEAKPKIVPLAQIQKLPVASLVRPLTREEVLARREIFNDRVKKLHENALTGLNQNVPTDRDNLVQIRSGMMEKYDYVDENHIAHQDYRWKEEISPEIREHYDWLMEYYKIHDDSIEEYNSGQQVKLPLGDYHVSVEGLNSIYESQGHNNCFCCAGTAMLNQFIRNKNKEAEATRRFNQLDMRAYRPQVKKYDHTTDWLMDEAQRKEFIKELDSYAGADKSATGNIFELGDFFLDKLEGQNVMLNKMYFNMPPQKSSNKERDNLKSNNMKAAFMDKINEVISSGNVVSFLEVDGVYGHYLTITGIDGEMISYLDSNKKEQSQTTHKRSVDAFLKRFKTKGNQIEIAWLSEMKTPEQMTSEYSNLNYNEETGYSLKQQNADSVQNVSQVKGIAVRKEFKDMAPGMEDITQVAYFANPLAATESETIEQALESEEQINGGEEFKEEENKEEQKEERNEEEHREEQNEEEHKEEERKEEEHNEEDHKEERGEEENKEEEHKEEEQKEEDKQEEHKENEERQAIDTRETRERGKTKVQRKTLSADQLARMEKAREISDVKEKIVGNYKKKTWKQKREDRKVLSKYEKKNKDYETFGVGFSLNRVDVTAADSKYMRNIKTALAEYLRIREAVFKAHGFKKDFTSPIRDKVSANTQENYAGLIHDIRNAVDAGRLYSISDDERQELGNAYDVVKYAVDEYRSGHSRLLSFGRGAARYRQVRLVEEQLMLDNTKLFLSKNRRGILKTVDMKYEKRDSVLGIIMPTWHRCIRMGDEIDLANQRYREKRRRQKAEGTLPPWYKRLFEREFKLGLSNNIRRVLMAYNGIGGLVDRTIGLGTMIAANSLIVAGKTVKAPLKVLSGIFNGASKYIFRSKKRWKVDYNLAEGWKSIDDGRRIFRKYLKGAFILPAAVGETIYRGIPYIFGHQFKSGVYKRSGRWTRAIVNDVKDVARGLGIKDYGAADRADADYLEAGGIAYNEKGKIVVSDRSNELTADDLHDMEFEENTDKKRSEEHEKESRKQSYEYKEIAAEPVDMTAKIMFKGKEIQPTVFKEYQWGLGGKVAYNAVTKEQFFKTVGGDPHGDSLKSVRKEITDQRKELLGENVTDDSLSAAYESTYKVATGKEVKSGKSAEKLSGIKDRLALQDHVARELGIYTLRREQDLSDAINGISEDQFKILTSKLKKENVKNALLNMAVFTIDDKEKTIMLSDYGNKAGVSIKISIGLVYREIMKIRVEDYVGTDDVSFMTGLAQKYKIVCDVASCEEFLRDYSPFDVISNKDFSITELKAKISFFKQLKEYYDDRIRMTASPYYTLLSKEDISSFLGKNGEKNLQSINDDALKEYIRLCRKIYLSPLMAGERKDVMKRYNASIDTAKEEQSKTDAANVKGVLSEIAAAEKEAEKIRKKNPEILEKYADYREVPEGDGPEEIALRKVFFDKLDSTSRDVDCSDEEFIKDHQIAFYGGLMHEMQSDEIHSLEKKLYESIFDDKSAGGALIPDKLRDDLKKDFQSFMTYRKEIYAIVNCHRLVTDLTEGLGVDLNNEKFLKTAAGKKLKSLNTFLEDIDYFVSSEQPMMDYMDSLCGMYKKLAASGVDIFPELTQDIRAHEDETVEKFRINTETAYHNKGNLPKEERWDIPATKLGDREFIIYPFSVESKGIAGQNVLNNSRDIIGKNLEIKEEYMWEAQELLQKLSDLTRKDTIIATRYRDRAGGDEDHGKKMMYYMAYHDVYSKEITRIVERLSKLSPAGAAQAEKEEYESMHKKHEKFTEKGYVFYKQTITYQGLVHNKEYMDLYEKGKDVWVKGGAKGMFNRDAAIMMKHVEFGYDGLPNPKFKENHEWNLKWLRAFETDDVKTREDMIAEYLPHLLDGVIMPELSDEELDNPELVKQKLDSWIEENAGSEEFLRLLSVVNWTNLDIDQIKRVHPAIKEFLDNNPAYTAKSDFLFDVMQYINNYTVLTYRLDIANAPDILTGKSVDRNYAPFKDALAVSVIEKYRDYLSKKDQPFVPYKKRA